jgi:thiol-disulfide isomerase/thioredoxin
MEALKDLLNLTTLKWLAAVLLVAGFAWHYGGGGGGSGPKVGKAAPDFTVPMLEAEDFKLSAHQGKVIVLDFWATWCPPCKASLPALQRVYDRHKDSAEVLVVSVNTDNAQAQSSKVPGYMRMQKLDFPVLFDRNNAVSLTYNVQSIPTMVVVGRSGKVHSVQVGLPAGNTAGIEAHLEKKIAEALAAD